MDNSEIPKESIESTETTEHKEITEHKEVILEKSDKVENTDNTDKKDGKSKLACCIDIVRKLSPSKIEHNITGNVI